MEGPAEARLALTDGSLNASFTGLLLLLRALHRQDETQLMYRLSVCRDIQAFRFADVRIVKRRKSPQSLKGSSTGSEKSGQACSVAMQ